MHTLPLLSSRHRQHYRPSFLNQLTSTSFSTLLFPLLLLLLSPQPTDCQGASLYKPITYAASAVLADDHLYLYGGVTQFAVKNVGTNQFLKLNLTASFDTGAAPWTGLLGGLTFTMVQAEPSKFGRHFVTGGNRDNLGTLSHIYSIDTGDWTAAPTFPDLPKPAEYKRNNVGMALDRVTGLIYIYGGIEDAIFSRQLALLDTSFSDANKMNWVLTTDVTSMEPLYEPFVVFLPTKNQTLVFGGCNAFNSTSGFVKGCFPLKSGYLISNSQSKKQPTIEPQSFLGATPSMRYQSCRVVLPNGNVFIQGGKDKIENAPNDNFFADAWILDVTTWTWKSVTIIGPQAEMARAGHTCQLGANGQIVVVGGKAFNLRLLRLKHGCMDGQPNWPKGGRDGCL